MGQFGERLRREREMRGITLEEIAEATKIGSRSLRALETEDFAKLPGGIFNKGFVRSYARYLGIDTEQAVTDFLAAEATYYQNTPNAAGNTSSEVSAPRTSGSWLVIAVAVVIVAAIIFGGWKYWSSRSAARSSPRQTSRGAANAGAKSAGSEGQAGTPARAASADGHPTTTAAGASNNAPPGASLLGPSNETHVGTAALGASNETHVGTAAPGASNETHVGTAALGRAGGAEPRSAVEINASPDAGFVVSIRARKSSWVTINADGKPVLNAMLDADAERSVRAHDRMTMTLGNPSGIELSYNGKPLSVAAQDNQVKTLVFTSQGLTQ